MANLSIFFFYGTGSWDKHFCWAVVFPLHGLEHVSCGYIVLGNHLFVMIQMKQFVYSSCNNKKKFFYFSSCDLENMCLLGRNFEAPVCNYTTSSNASCVTDQMNKINAVLFCFSLQSRIDLLVCPGFKDITVPSIFLLGSTALLYHSVCIDKAFSGFEFQVFFPDVAAISVHSVSLLYWYVLFLVIL